MIGSELFFKTVVAALLFPLVVLCQLQQTTEQSTRQAWRLPGDIIPVQQWVEIYTSLVAEEYRFWGSSTIQIEILEDTQQIILHSSGLTIEEADVSLTYANGDALQAIEILSQEYNADFKFYIINVNEILITGTRYFLYIPFSALLEVGSSGYFRNSYVDESGETIWFAATYMNAGEASTVFPCFDEPAMKPIWSISLAHADNLIALSNMDTNPEETYEITDMEGWVMTVFNDTPPMSSYLVGFILCQFEVIELQNGISIWTRREVINELLILEDAAPTIFSIFNCLFIPYPLPKLDLILVPSYPSSMGTFGYVMFIEADMLFDADSDLFTPSDIVLGIAHQIAHQWFGGMVSDTYWHEIWVSEGFANYFQEFGLSEYFSLDVYLGIRFALIYRNALNDDGFLAKSRALVTPIESPTNLRQNVSTFTRAKSFFIIRLMAMILTHDVFVQGLRTYLQTYLYGVASQFDLLTILTEVGVQAQIIPSDFDLNVVMQAWTYEKGIPVVTVSIDYANQVVYFSQSRFLSETVITAEELQSVESQCWTIPISYTTRQLADFESTIPQIFLDCTSESMLIIDDLTQEDWIIMNINIMVPARFNYDLPNWLLIAETLLNESTTSIIQPLNRMQILSDSFKLAVPGLLPYEIPLTIAPYLVFENFEHVWRAALYALGDIHILLQRSDLLEPFEAYVRTFMEPKFLQLGAIDVLPEDFLEASLKLFIDASSCTYAMQDCLDQCLNVLLQWYNTAEPDINNPINVNIRDFVYRRGIQQGDDDLWNFLFNRYSQTTDSDEKLKIINGLGCSTNENILSDFLLWSLDPNIIDPSDRSSVFFSVLENRLPIGYNAAYNFLANNFEDLVLVLGDDTSTIGSYIRALGYPIQSAEELQNFQTILETAAGLTELNQDDIDTALHSANFNIGWHNLHDDEIAQFLYQ